ncbi:hypothetical protein JTB14_006585 [Gonioctena quinquepunctata]|nr:hypothetical protein JTB14_006585 [Gonioctena quinquepunctata]
MYLRPTAKKVLTSSKKNRKSADLPTTSKTAATDVWMCSACDNDYVADSDPAYHVAPGCVRNILSKENTEDFTCPECMP